MDKSGHNKNKKPKSAKKRKCDGPSCSMFLAELTRKLAASKSKRTEELETKNIVQSIISSLTNALPFKFSLASSPQCASPAKIETLQKVAAELKPSIVVAPVEVVPEPPPETNSEDISLEEVETATQMSQGFKMPKMPLLNSEVLKLAKEKRTKVTVQEQAVNTGTDHDVASELAKHVGTLKKISLIAEEFNTKTARNLKEIVHSVQQDLIQKMEEVRAERERAGPSSQQEQQESDDDET